MPKTEVAVKGKNLLLGVSIAVALGAVAIGSAMSAQDKYTLKVPNGLAFSEFRGYEAGRPSPSVTTAR